MHPLLECVIEMERQAQRVPFIRLEQACLPPLHMHDIDRKAEFLQVLHKRPMVMPGDFEQHVGLWERYILLDPVDQGAETLARLVKCQGWAVFEALMA